MSKQTEDLGHSIKKLQSRHHKSLDARLQAIGISLVQWNALREIDRNPGSSAHALALLTFNSDQSFGTLTTRLAKLGFLKRKPGEGRANIHTLTSPGKKLLNEGKKIMSDFLELSFKPLNTEERAMLLEFLTRLLNATF